MQAEYDEGGSIGKRYRRQDEIGTPWCVTIDHQTLEDRTVTVRDRDSLEQERVAIDELPGWRALAAPWRRRSSRGRRRLIGPNGVQLMRAAGRTDAISYDDLVRALGAQQLARDGDRLLARTSSTGTRR